MSLQRRDPLVKQGWVRALLLFLVYLVLSVLASILVAVYMISSKSTSPNKATSADNIASVSLELTLTLSFVIAVISVFVCRKFLDRRSFLSLGLYARQIFPEGLTGFLLGIALVGAGALVIYFLNGMSWVEISFEQQNLLTSVLLLLMVAIAEELVFRGYILRNLCKSFNEWIALVISAALFALVHCANPGLPVIGIINIFLGGLVLGITYMHIRSLWAPILFHFGWNFFQGPVLGFPVSGLGFSSIMTAEEPSNALLNGGTFGFEGSIVCTAMLLISFLVLFGLYHTKKPSLEGS